MANGDLAAAQGWTTVSSTTDLVKDGYDNINYAMDRTAEVKTEIRPISRGGTGANTAMAALNALGVYVQSTDPGHANGRVWIKTPA